MLDGNSEHVVHTSRKLDPFKNDFELATLDLNKCLEQIKLPNPLYTCALISDLPSYIGTMSTIVGDPDWDPDCGV